MKDIEIKVVKNGYMVSPAYSAANRYIESGEVLVFETFDALIEWMGSNMTKPVGIEKQEA